MTPERWRQVSEIFQAALARDPESRDGFLTHACGTDLTLRDEVDALMAAHREAGAFGDHPVFLPGPLLESGTSLGPYQIDCLLGTGGMGEVYRARDRKLGRDVAIKVLSPHFMSDHERLARFEREARVLASLNHPHIAAIYGIEDAGVIHGLVLELVEGLTVADRIEQGPLAIEEALAIARQTAGALEAAHDKGIVHRDLKPANIKITPDGVVKVLDFGLAKADSRDSSGRDRSQSPTITVGGTREGLVLGTTAYMSPEQARGHIVDKRTDIWAFGCVLFEMLAGRRAFDGETRVDILAQIVEREPAWTALPATTPSRIVELLWRCLTKDSRERLRDIGDARVELDEALRSPADHPGAQDRAWPVVNARQPLKWWTAGTLTLIVATAVLVWMLKPTPRAPSVEIARTLVSVTPAEYLRAASESGTSMALSSDGKYVVFVGARGDAEQLYLRALDRIEATPLAGTEVKGTILDNPFFSPDGQWIGFWVGSSAPAAVGELKKVPRLGGAATTLCQTPNLYGASWGAHDWIVFANNFNGGLWRVSASGGMPQALTTIDASRGEVSHRFPQMLPGGDSILFTVLRTGYEWNDAQIVVRSLTTGEQKLLVEGGADARYLPSGHLVYARTGSLMAAPFDVSRLVMTGRGVDIIEGVTQEINMNLSYGGTGAAQFSVSDSGTLVYAPGGIHSVGESSLEWVDRTGAVKPLSAPPHHYLGPRLSPDGHRIAVFTSGQDTQVWIYEIARGSLTRVTTEERGSYLPIWTPDGTRVTFGVGRAGNLFWKLFDGGGPARRLTTDDHALYPGSWSPDGKTLAFVKRLGETNYDIWTLSLGEGETRSQPFLQTPFKEESPEFSPDGHWLAYVSNESGRREVYVLPYPGPGSRQPISTEGGVAPAWARSGRELFYQVPIPDANLVSKMMAVDVTTGPTFTAGKPRMLFEGRYDIVGPVRGYDVTANGRRFLMTEVTKQPPTPRLTQLVLVQNWTEDLKRLVPAR